MNKKIILGIVVFVGFIIFSSSAFVVNQMEQALIVQFGEPIKVITEPGLKFKIPFIQEALFFDNRILDSNVDSKEVIASDKKRIIINAFAKYKIVDPLTFYRTVRTEYGLKSKLDTIMDSSLRQVVGNVPLNDLLTEQRGVIMENMQKVIESQSQVFGIKIVDVRIMRGDLPKENSQAIYKRMQAEREREAKEIRANGVEMSEKIRAKANKDKVVLLAEANKQSEILRGEGDGEASRIFANAFSRDVKFFEFYRSMQAYRRALNDDKTNAVISPDDEFFKYFGKLNRVNSSN